MPADLVSALLALVGVLGPDGVGVAARDERQLGEARHALLGPVLEQRAVAVPVAGDDPRGRVAHLVDQRVPQPVSRVEDLDKAKTGITLTI